MGSLASLAVLMWRVKAPQELQAVMIGVAGHSPDAQSRVHASCFFMLY